MKWCRWVYVTLKFFLCNQLRVHTSWALVELEWRLKVFPSTSIFVFEIHRFKVCSLILEFWNLHSACYRLWMKYIRSSFRCVCFVCNTNINISNNWCQSGLQFLICLTCFVSFRIRDDSFILLEDYVFNFLHVIETMIWWKLKLMLWCCLNLNLSTLNWILRL